MFAILKLLFKLSTRSKIDILEYFMEKKLLEKLRLAFDFGYLPKINSRPKKWYIILVYLL